MHASSRAALMFAVKIHHLLSAPPLPSFPSLLSHHGADELVMIFVLISAVDVDGLVVA